MPLIRAHGWLGGTAAVAAVRYGALAGLQLHPDMPLHLPVNPRYQDKQKSLLHFFLQNPSSGLPFQAAATPCKTSRGILQVKYKEIKSRSPTKLQLYLRSGVFAGLLGQTVVAPSHSKTLQRPSSLRGPPSPERAQTH